jgi:N-methylhydantoinase B/oxoprolinase/acetone carboxylase alpha subunit
VINRDEFTKALEQIRDLRAQLAAERYMHDRLRARVAEHGEAAGKIAADAIRESRGHPTPAWRRASTEQAAALSILRDA